MPALNAAIEALSQLSKGDIVEVNAMKKPPGGVVLVSKALCWCFGVKPKKVPSPDGKGKIDDYWDPSKKALLFLRRAIPQLYARSFGVIRSSWIGC